MRIPSLILMIMLMGMLPVFAQQADSSLITSPDSVSISTTPDSLTAQPPASEVEDDTGGFPIWERGIPAGADRITTDSLLRWQVWPQYGDFTAYRPDAISFRQGTTGRLDAFNVRGYDQREQRLFIDGMNMANPLTGMANFNYVPMHKISRVYEQAGDRLDTRVRLRDYYVLEPISYLNYEEAKYNFRNLEFMVAQNLSERTNVELSFWDRRDGDSYPENEVIGSQVFAKVYHFLNPLTRVKAHYIRNEFGRSESFGYQVTDPLAFPFGRFAPSPVQRGVQADEFRSDMQAGIYVRRDTSEAEHAGLEMRYTRNEFEMYYPSDSLFWNLRSLELKGFYEQDLGPLQLGVRSQASYHDFADDRVFSIGNWGHLNAEARASFSPGNAFRLQWDAALMARTDGRQGTNSSLTVGFSGNRLGLELQASYFDRMPEIQHLYWNSALFRGNEDLRNEQGVALRSALTLKLGDRITTGVSGRYRVMDRQIYLGADSTFANSSSFPTISGTLFGTYNGNWLELESSATADALNLIGDQSLPVNNQLDGKLWIRNNLWVKGYVFERAAYVKGGIRTLVSPFAYESLWFNTGAQFWQNSSQEAEIPAFFRMDAEVSARVRGIMVVIRWENVLDGIGQLGYFESATFPMPERRLMIGIRAQFRN